MLIQLKSHHAVVVVDKSPKMMEDAVVVEDVGQRQAVVAHLHQTLKIPTHP